MINKLSNQTADAIYKYVTDQLLDNDNVSNEFFAELEGYLHSLVNESWINIKDKLPQDKETVWGSTGNYGYAWVFSWSEEHNHFLEYTDKRGGRWEFTHHSNKVIKWHPLP